MADTQDQPLQYLPQTEDAALAQLQAELSTQSAMLTNEAANRGAEAEHVTNTLASQNEFDKMLLAQAQTPAQPSRVITNDTLKAKRNVIATYAPGEKFTASGNVEPAINADGSVSIINNMPPTNTNPDKIAAAKLNRLDIGGPERGFDAQAALETAKTLGGTLLQDFTAKTLADIDVQVSKEVTRLRQAAAIESGYTAAKAAYDRQVELDNSTGFAQRFNQASAQTKEAMQMMIHSRSLAAGMLHELVASDSSIAALNGSKQAFMKIEARRGAMEAKADSKAEQAADLVTPDELANYRYAYGTTGNDQRDAIVLLNRRKADKSMDKVLKADGDNIHHLLVDPDPNVAEHALKIFVGFEKAANPNIPKDATETDTSKLIKKVIARPMELLKQPGILPPKELELATKELTNPKGGKELLEAKSQWLPIMLRRYVEMSTIGKFEKDLTQWAAPEVLKGPLQAAVMKAAATNPEGKAPMRSVIDLFIADKTKSADGSEMKLAEKVGILSSAINNSVPRIPKNLFVDANSLDAYRLQFLATSRVLAAQAHVANSGMSSMLGRMALEWGELKGLEINGQ